MTISSASIWQDKIKAFYVTSNIIIKRCHDAVIRRLHLCTFKAKNLEIQTYFWPVHTKMMRMHFN